ncbi:hypothetical protein [Rhizobium sp. Root708]|uniref:hypothetical protein n=1 Tax=Rhizobium sp. Root708 TaxID=1736592 RepID=UPI0012E3E242|nr:hypothetical protein [Rhizobium sp. Root708]
MQADHTGEHVSVDLFSFEDASLELAGTQTRTEESGGLIDAKAKTIAAIAQRIMKPGKILPDGSSPLYLIVFS